MAFQMIPPRVSSSPPPLDSLPSAACPGDDDEDEEFGTFATHSTFDITGLSDKLPPTPEHNPTACVGDKNVALSVRDSNGTKGTLTTGRLPHLPSSEKSVTLYAKDINGDLSGSLEIDDDGNEFGDFSFFTSSATSGHTISADGKAREERKTGDIESSQKCNLEPKVDSSPNHSVCSFSMIATPPPLDHVVDNIVVDDEFSRISPVDDNDDDFGDFTACTFDNSKDSSYPVVDTAKECTTLSQNNLEDDRPYVLDESDHNPDVTCDEGLPCTASPVIVHETPSGIVCESLTQGESDPHDTSEVKSVLDSYSGIIDRTTSFEGCNNASSDTKECNLNKSDGTTVYNEGTYSDLGKDCSLHNLASSGPLTDRGTSSECSLPEVVEDECNQGSLVRSNRESCLAQNLSIVDNSNNYSLELESENISKTKLNEVSACPSSKKDNVRTEFSEGNEVKKGEDSGKASLTLKDTNGDEFECDWEFRDFDKAENDDDVGGGDDDDDDLDFGDLREQVRSGKFGMNESVDTDDDFGDFYDGTHTTPQVLNEDDDQEFGEFGAAVVEDENTDEFGDFAQVEPGDSFGKFASSEGQVFEKGVTNENALQEDEDEFGDFTSQQNVENQSDFRVPWHEYATSTSAKDNPVLRKLESLMLKWIPREPLTSTSETQENRIVPTLFQSVEDDAFVWRQLENLEASAALTLSWGNTQAQTLYLSSVNVDARNILFGQKWSSSVPLFAQTLSFSPLTPAKPTENGCPLDGGNRGSVSPPILSSGITPKFSAGFRKDKNQVEITSDNENTPEEQIPPAKFDWTSSGLTNPLEGPAYNSPLFDMDLLLSNSDIGKGATNALLASLEREFLSEGGEKGTAGRIKGPPAPSPLVQQILGSGMNSTQSAATPLQSLSSEIRELVENLPDIGFMRSRVLMFPIRGED